MDGVAATIEDVCRRVFGHDCQVSVAQQGNVWCVELYPATETADPLTRSQQEMDVILCLQHLLCGAEVRLRMMKL